MSTDKKADDKGQELQEKGPEKQHYYASPAVDMYETDQAYTISYDLPGVKKEDVAIKVEKDILTVTAGAEDDPVRDHECLRAEMNYSGYKRSFHLNSQVDVDNIKADYREGVLTLTLPKPEEKKPKEITISAH